MNEQRFTVHINFIRNREFVEKIEKNRVSGTYLDFLYFDDYYISFARNDLGDHKNLLLATLYPSNVPLMEKFRSRDISFLDIFDHHFNIVSDNLLVMNSSNYGIIYKKKTR